MAVPGVQVTTIEPAPLLLATSTLLLIADIVPKSSVPKSVLLLLPELPNAQPLVISAVT